MKKIYIIVAVIIIAAIIGVWKFSSLDSDDNIVLPTSTSTPAVVVPASTSTPTAASTGMKSTGVLLSGSRYANNAYLVFPGTPSGKAAQALDGFDLQSKDLGNGMTQVTLVAKKSTYHTQTFTLGATDKLYFIETSWGDDSPEQDYEYGDDMGVAVNAAGYILQ